MSDDKALVVRGQGFIARFASNPTVAALATFAVTMLPNVADEPKKAAASIAGAVGAAGTAYLPTKAAEWGE